MSSVYQAASSRLNNIASQFNLSLEQVLAELSEKGFEFYIPMPSDYIAVAVDSRIFDGHGVDERERYRMWFHRKPLVLKSASMLRVDSARFLKARVFWHSNFKAALQPTGEFWSEINLFADSAVGSGRRNSVGGADVILQKRSRSIESSVINYDDLRSAEPVWVSIDNLHAHPGKIEEILAVFQGEGKGLERELDLSFPHYTQTLRVMWEVFRETWFLRDLTAEDVRNWKNIVLVELQVKGHALKSGNASNAALAFITPRDYMALRAAGGDGVVKRSKWGEIDPRFDVLVQTSRHFWEPCFGPSGEWIEKMAKSEERSQKVVAEYIRNASGNLFNIGESKVAAAIINPCHIAKKGQTGRPSITGREKRW